MAERDPWSEGAEAMADHLQLREYAATMSPEEYIARKAHTYVLAGPLARHFPEPGFDAWVGRAYDLLLDRAPVVALRERYLTPAEIAAAEAYENDPL